MEKGSRKKRFYEPRTESELVAELKSALEAIDNTPYEVKYIIPLANTISRAFLLAFIWRINGLPDKPDIERSQ